MNKNTLAIALASVLAGGVATAAYLGNRTPAASQARVQADLARPSTLADEDRPLDEAAIPAGPRLEFAQVISSRPVTERTPRYATVIGTEPVRESVTASTPREVCEDVAVEERMPERDGNVGGTVAGALIGGLVGNQVGDGNGRKAATVAGAAAGGYIGNRIDRRHEGGQVVTRTERQCRTVSETTTSQRTVAWNVTYRTPDGSTATMRTDRRPGERIRLGSEEAVRGYDVTYRYRGEVHRLRMDTPPGDRLPVIDGQVMAGGAAGDTPRG